MIVVVPTALYAKLCVIGSNSRAHTLSIHPPNTHWPCRHRSPVHHPPSSTPTFNNTNAHYPYHLPPQLQVRLQSQSPSELVKVRYTGILDCATKTMQNEGVQGFFKGMVRIGRTRPHLATHLSSLLSPIP